MKNQPQDIHYRNIILARESKGLSQRDLADRLAISPGKLSKVENGLQDLPEDKIDLLLQVLDHPLEFFTERGEVHDLSTKYYRKLAKTSKADVKQFEAIANKAQKHLGNLLNSIELPKANVPEFDPDLNPAQHAQKLRRAWAVPVGPIDNLTALVEKHGIVVYYIDFDIDGISGLSFYRNDDIPIVIINRLMSSDRKRATLAHELGHLVLHFKQGDPNTVEAEKQAWQFAGELLLPEAEVKEQLYGLTIPTLAKLKRIWRVSMAMLIQRAKALSTFASEYEYRSLLIQMSSAGYKKEEPRELDPPTEESIILKEVINIYKQELGYSDEEIAKVLRLSVQDYLDYYNPKPKPKIFKINIEL